MLITPDDINGVRPVSRNIDPARIGIYINEAEMLDVLPAIGAAEYRRLTAREAELTDEEKLLLDGGYYEECCGGELVHFEGLRKALAYLAYARFVFSQPAQVTPFGVVIKSGDESSPADARMVAAMANDARKIGQEHLAAAVRYWDRVMEQRRGVEKVVRRRFLKIGD